MKAKISSSAAALSLLILTACGGGSSDEDPPVIIDPPIGMGDVEGLEMPEIISIITDPGDPSPKTINVKSSKPFDDAGTDYTDDLVRSYVWDESMGPMQQVNQILCYISQTRADELVNETYTALVDTGRCERESESDDSTDQSSSANETEYQLWTIDSSRESDTAAQVVRIWVPSEDPEGNETLDQQNILVQVTINSSPNDLLPFGDFDMNWQGVVEVGGNEEPTMAGTIKTVENQDGKLQFIFFNSADTPDFSFTEAANVILDDADGTTGIGKTATHRVDPNFEFHSEFSVAYDPTRFLRGNDTNNDGAVDSQSCNDRTDLLENVWRYNLYGQADGARVELNSGFPFVASVGGQQLDGYMSYWGMWLPGGIDKSSITSITEQDFSDQGTHTTYDVTHSPGRLVKRTKSTIALADMEGSSFNYWADLEYLVEYTSDNVLNNGVGVNAAGFYQIATIQFGSSGRETTPITPVLLDVDFLQFYSEVLNGSIAYDRIADPNNVIAFQQEFVSGNGGDLFGSATQVTFACYQDCLKAGITTAQLELNNDTPFLANSEDPTVPAALYTYSLTDLTLRDAEGNAIGMAADQQAANGGFYDWGIQTGLMVLEGTTLTNVWDTWNQEVSYQWETGPNDWNQMTHVSLTGASEFIQFDRPIQFIYNHVDANDRNLLDGETSEYDGQVYRLEYGGPGNLWGFPDSQSEDGRYQRSFSLADATTLTNSGGDFVVKATEIEKRMRDLEIGNCTEGVEPLALTGALEIALPTETDVSSVPFTLADKPVITDSPRVVGGEIIGQ